MWEPTHIVTLISVICIGWSSGAADAIVSSSLPKKYSPIPPDLPRHEIGSLDRMQSTFQAQNFWPTAGTGITKSVASSGIVVGAHNTEGQNSEQSVETLPNVKDKLATVTETTSLAPEEIELPNVPNLLDSSTSYDAHVPTESFLSRTSLNFTQTSLTEAVPDDPADKTARHGLSNVTFDVRKELVNKTREDSDLLSESRNDSNSEKEKVSPDSSLRSKALKGNLTSAKLRPFGITAEYLMTITLRNGGDQKSPGRGRRYTTNKTSTAKEEGNKISVQDGHASGNQALVNDSGMSTANISMQLKENVAVANEHADGTMSGFKNGDAKREKATVKTDRQAEDESGSFEKFYEINSENRTVYSDNAHEISSGIETSKFTKELHLTEAPHVDSKPTSNISSINHLNLELLEEELAKKRNSEDLLFAISILQHHPVPEDKPALQNVSLYRNFLNQMENATDDQKISFKKISNGGRNIGNVADSFYSSREEKKYTEELIQNEEDVENFEKYERNPLMSFANDDIHPEKTKETIKTRSFTAALPNTMFVDGQLSEGNDATKDIDFGKKYSSEMLPELPEPLYSSSGIGFLPNDIMLSNLMHNQRASSSNAKEIGKKKPSALVSPNMPLPGRPQIAHGKVSAEKSTKWLILVMDGDCGIISKRMNTFVMFLKAALSAKLDTKFDDIVIMSVFCDNTFMVNISLETSLYSKALTQLQALAEANTTLLEISGEIFYLEKVLTQDSKALMSRLKGSSNGEDVELIVYIAVGCVCAFILLSVFILTVISICNQEDGELREIKTEPLDRSDFPIRKPNVIYSHKFTQELNPEKYRLTPFEDSSLGGVTPSDSVSFDAPRFGSERAGQHSAERCCDRKVFITPSSSKIQLLEEVQEEDEDEFEDGGVLEGDEDYHEEDEDAEDLEDDEDDEFIIESMTRPLHAHHHHHHHHHHQQNHQRNQVTSSRSGGVHTSACCHGMSKSQNEESFTGNFDNPCYDR